MKERKLYDVTAPNKSTGIVNGESSNILNWSDIRYQFARTKYKKMISNTWFADEVDMSTDIKQFPHLTDHEQESFLKIIGLLAFLDSVQSDYVQHIADYVTDSSLNATLITLAFQEVVHNESYTYVLSSLVNRAVQDRTFDYWRTDEVLRERNDFLAKGYEKFTNEKTVENFLESMVYDVILEGLFFYSGFAFFYNLARNKKMLATAKMINFINRDEQIHVGFFCDLFKAVLEENPQIDKKKMEQFVINTFTKAAELEINWASYIIGNKIEGLNVVEVQDYVKFMANKRVNELGFGKERIFEGYRSNPLRWIQFYETEGSKKTDFFERKPDDYKKAGSSNGFDEL